MTSDNSQDEIAALKSQSFIQLVALIVVTTTLTAVLYRQASMATKDIAQSRQLIQQFDKQLNLDASVIDSFVGKLVTYGQKHPDFLPVLKKYGITPPASPVTPPAAPKK